MKGAKHIIIKASLVLTKNIAITTPKIIKIFFTRFTNKPVNM